MNCHTANFSENVNHRHQPIVKEIPSYVKDTQVFPKKLQKVKDISEESLLVTLDVSLDETHLVAVRDLIQLRSFNKVRQRGELN